MTSLVKNFPVKIVNDLAGWLANVATPAVEYFYNLKTGETLHNDPSLNSLQALYDWSAPAADLNGNADAIGIWWAYQVLSEANPNPQTESQKLKLSDVFTLYYLGASQLRPEINPPLANPIHPFYTSENRWKIFALFFHFIESDGSGGYNWLPDDNTEWPKIMHDYDVTNFPQGRSYNSRLFGFALFWYNVIYNPQPYTHYPHLSFDLFFNLEFPNDDIIQFDDTAGNEFNNTGLTEKEFTKQQVTECFVNTFLSDLKINKLNL